MAPMSLPLLLTLALQASPAGMEVLGRHYQAVVGSAGQLLSLRVGAAEALDTMALGGGGAMLDPLPVILDRFQREVDYVSARGADAVITYQPGADRLLIHTLNASARPRVYRLATAPGWRVEGRRAVGKSGAALVLARPESVTASPWSVPVPAWGAADIELRFERPASLLVGGDAVWAEAQTLTPGRFEIPGKPPYVDPTATQINLPLVLCNDSDEDRATVVTSSIGDTVVSESVTLSARRAHGYEVRLSAPPPGAHRVRVRVRAGVAESASECTLAFAPERWPEAVSPTAPLPAGRPLRPVLRADSTLPKGWQSARLTDGAAEHGDAVWPVQRGGDALLLLGTTLPGSLAGARLGLAVGQVNDAWLPSLWSFMEERGRTRYGLFCGLSEALDLSRLSRAAVAVAAWGPPWPRGTDRPLLIGQVVEPGQAVFMPRQEAGETWVYTCAAEVARRHFDSAAAAWLAARLKRGG
ncbi:MAG: hypothetical protein HZB16_20950 [Armatimonadetes bacterium]|nr:hypothetical protein [Armatimonadota bacterium]